MPDLPLFDHDAHPDGFHDVRNPGGYEWWYFDAHDERSDTQVVAIFMQGFIFHGGYLRAYRRFRRRPTRTAPPLPGDFPCAYLCVYRGGRIWRQFFTQYPAGSMSASRDRPGVVIGANSMRFDGDAYQLDLAGHPWKLTARGPQTDRSRTLSASLRFAPRTRHAPVERVFLSREMTGADHRWAIVAPSCDVSGRLDCGATPADRVSIDFVGHGYHDHNFGTAPIGDGLRRWTWGRAMFGDHVLTFHHAVARDASLADEVHLLETSPRGIADVDRVRTHVGPMIACKPAMMLGYPSSIRFTRDDQTLLELSRPRVVDPAPFYMRLIYDAHSRGERSSAFCEIAYPHRLRWPLLGRMVEMSFDKRTKDMPPLAP